MYQRYDPKSATIQKGTSKDAVGDIARIGSQALVIFSIVSLVGSVVMPWVVVPPPSDSANRKPPPDNKILGEIVRRIKPYRPTLGTAWLASHLLFAFASFYAVFVSTLAGATVLVALCGV